MPLSQLSPPLVWRHFATLCATPRPSKHEAALVDHLMGWASSCGFDCATDETGNLLIRKAASAGYEAAPTLALQGHLDMVCQARSGVSHEFLRTPITPGIDGDWLHAETTTLGADNGIGVALALAVLEDTHLRHGPLEVLLTVDEEAGMGGAIGLQPGWLKATRMINLDTEEWGEFYLGCAGGCDVNVSATLPQVPLADGNVLFELRIEGLRGGHSGCDIHRRRGNANRLLAAALATLLAEFGDRFQLLALRGGTARNALPREATALLALPAVLAGQATRGLDKRVAEWESTLIGPDGEHEIVLRLEQMTTFARSALDTSASSALISALNATPYGIRTLSGDFAGVVETSNNLGIIDLAEGKFTANLMVRSLRDDEPRRLATDIGAVFQKAGFGVTVEGHYPGWTPNPTSPLLALCQRVYRRTFSTDAAVQVIHAGLECGIIGAKYPGLDTVSFGPTIRGAHAPGERVEIASVGRCWTLLCAIISELATLRQPA